MKSVTCKCGEICLEIENDPMMHFMCHCKDCHSLFNGPAKVLIYTDDDICITGAHSTYSYQGGSGNDLHVTFCSNCGTRAYTRPDLIEGLTYVFASMLEEHIEFQPKVELFAYNRSKWEHKPASVVESYDHNGTLERIQELLENLEQRG